MCAASPASVQRHCAAAASCTCRPQHVSTLVVELTHKGRLRHTVQLRGGRGTRHWQCNASALLGTCPPKASVHQQRRPARRELRPRTVAIATLGHHEPAHGLPDRPQRLVGSGLRWSSLVGRVLAPAGVNSPGLRRAPSVTELLWNLLVRRPTECGTDEKRFPPSPVPLPGPIAPPDDT